MEQAARTALAQLESSQLKWTNDKGKPETIAFADEKAKRLISILVKAAELRGEDSVTGRKRKDNEDEEFYAELTAAWTAESQEVPTDDKIDPKALVGEGKADSTPWLLERIESVGFGGINGPGASESFSIEFAEGSTCLLGGNGAGKTSLVSAVAWALTGQRINDATGLSAAGNKPRPMFDRVNPSKQIGMWPPVATYPIDTLNPLLEPSATVTLTFRKFNTEETAQISRTWEEDVDDFTVVKWDGALEPLRQCLDVAVEMPLRISQLRVGQPGHLNDAIASLTGLDVLTGIGELVAVITPSNSKFRNTPKKSEHDARRNDIEAFFEKAEQHLPSLTSEIAQFRKLDDWTDRTQKYDTELLNIANNLNQTAGEDLSSLKSYIDPTLDINLPEVQSAIDNAVAAAITTYDVKTLDEILRQSCPKLSAFRDCASEVEDTVKRLTNAADDAFTQLQRILDLHRRKLGDQKLGLKAAAAETHYRLHGDVPIEECTLCGRKFDTDSLKSLGSEVRKLLADADLLQQKLVNVCREVVDALDTATKSTITLSANEAAKTHPIDLFGGELRHQFITSQVFVKSLPEFATLFDRRFGEAKASAIPLFNTVFALVECEIEDLSADDQGTVCRALEAINGTKRAVEMVQWASTGVDAIDGFCSELLSQSPQVEASADLQTFGDLCYFLSRATKQAKPALMAAAELREAVKTGRIWLSNEKLRQIRAEISDAILPLKQLPKYAEAKVTRQLQELSGRIAEIAEKFHVSAGLSFQRALVEREPRKRKGTLRARASPRRSSSRQNEDTNHPDYEVDATLVANASWIRALLWAFLFALRERRAQQSNGLALPLMLMDDPQLTFDEEHHCAWIQFVLDPLASDGLSSAVQGIFTTYDKSFAHNIGLLIAEFPIKHIYGPPEEGRSIFVDGTELIARHWREAEATKANEATSIAIGELRKHLESMMHAIFPPAMGANKNTLGEMMNQFEQTNKLCGFPYGTPVFDKLIDVWKEPGNKIYRKALSEPHHNEQSPYNYEFGRGLFAWYRKGLYPLFHKAFLRVWQVREAGWKFPHSGMAEISAVRTGVSMGISFSLPANLNKVVARVAAESDGREVVIIEGQPSLKFVEETSEIEDLGELQAMVLTTATLEPAALVGDVLLISSSRPPTPNSLVVCQAEGARRARRFSPLSGSAIHAVLTANAVNPREIQQPILVEYKNEYFGKVVGIIYSHNWEIPRFGQDEVVTMESLEPLNTLLSRSEGLARIIGDSAEPIALGGQYLILAPQVQSWRDLEAHDGQPLVADRDGRILFKRLRLGDEHGPIVLESLDAAGRHPPVVISREEATQLGQRLTFRPVIGVLFDSQRKPVSR